MLRNIKTQPSGYTNAEAVAAVNAAGIVLADGKSVKLEETLATNLTASGAYIDGVAGCTVAIGDLIYLHSTDNRWELADASAEATAKGMLGIALSVGGDGDAITILLQGFIRCNASYDFGTGGAPLYMSITAGDMSETAPVASTEIVRVVGYAHDDADTIYFNPDATYVEIS